MMNTLSRRLRKLEDIQAEQEEAKRPSFADILRAGRRSDRAGGEVSPTKIVAIAKPRTPAETLRYRRQMRLAQAQQGNEGGQTE